ncbi:MAG TPA: hypothetical protein VM597_03875 [Gemmataceae bacterium]|jgi:multisubunit Na+/H+ antiporter MnhG subunit|nr:hypothetical protein [Gemmataceae bacterium]
MNPRSLFALRKAAMLGGMFLCFGAALPAYDRFGLDLTRLPLALHLAALIGPVLVGMILGYGLSTLVPLTRRRSSRERCDRRRRDAVAG